MRSGLKLGKIAGIAINVDWSWLLIFALVSWNLAEGFATLHPSWDRGLTIGLAIGAALLLFGSVLLHELAHAVVARSQGVPVRSITLFLFGGVADIKQEPPTPRAEFLIAIVGPLTSIVLGFICLVLGGLGIGDLGANATDPGQVYAALSPAATLLLWLGGTNLVLGIFNLIPGFPLDGGRVLRALLWAATGNLRRATRWATIGAHALAWLLIFAGIAMIAGVNVPFFGGGVLGGIWLAFIGWFLHSAATQSYQQVVARDLLAGVSVSQLIRKEQAATVGVTMTIEALVHDRILATEERAFPVFDGERLVGLVCLDDVRKVGRPLWITTTVGQIMTPLDQLAVAKPDDEAFAAFETLAERNVDQLPVVTGGRLVGLLRRRDILRWLQLQEGSPA